MATLSTTAIQANGTYADEQYVSHLTLRSVGSLRRDRLLRAGLPYIKFGHRVLYDLRDVEAYLQSRKIQTREAQPA